MDGFLQPSSSANDDGEMVNDAVTMEISDFADSKQADALFSEKLCPSVGEIAVDGEVDGHGKSFSVTKLDDIERRHYLNRLLSIEEDMQEARCEVQHRIDTMKRIVDLMDPMEQLSEYLALRQKARKEDDVDIVEDLVLCAKRMTNKEDSEVAMVGAFFFLRDRQQTRTRGMTAMLPVLAPMMVIFNKSVGCNNALAGEG
ncbi:hypothetical protein CCR75_005673 [Bremia lactucae]|uniref:Uncharacterized protein n=1 Tax=Bremia lactucae TaxID=4779 RepID=A0A976IEJ2_BRELC|nr:hypothetical protein CCR75_005673 [Bremia lactucae]